MTNPAFCTVNTALHSIHRAPCLQVPHEGPIDIYFSIKVHHKNNNSFLTGDQTAVSLKNKQPGQYSNWRRRINPPAQEIILHPSHCDKPFAKTYFLWYVNQNLPPMEKQDLHWLHIHHITHRKCTHHTITHPGNNFPDDTCHYTSTILLIGHTSLTRFCTGPLIPCYRDLEEE